jgi:cell wall-associated NlpC family hydrolase
MKSCFLLLTAAVGLPLGLPAADSLPFDTVFQGRARFQAVTQAAAPKLNDLRALPLGERVAWFGQLLVGTPYKGGTLEIHDHIEAVSCNLNGLDCWTFFESALALARLCDVPAEKWTPQSLLQYLEVDRYWQGRCTGSYLSRLHYLEDWAEDNHDRGLVADLTRDLGGVGVPNAAREMTVNARHYRYMKASAKNREGISELEARLRKRPLYMIPKSRVPGIESKLQNGDIIGIISRDGDAYGTSHVGIALRQKGVLRFMHASAPRNHGKVVIDSRLSDYLNRFKSHAGILVARPLR